MSERDSGRPLVALFRERAQALPEALRAHVGRVVSEARQLAQIYELDPDQVEAAAWGHDLYRAHSDADLLRAASGLGMTVDAVQQALPVLLHGPVAAETAQRAWGVDDAEVLEAICWHTTAHAPMSRAAMAVYLADKIEPEKVRDDPDLRAIRDLARRDPEAAVLAYLDRELNRHLARGGVIHPASIEARNALLLRRRA